MLSVLASVLGLSDAVGPCVRRLCRGQGYRPIGDVEELRGLEDTAALLIAEVDAV